MCEYFAIRAAEGSALPLRTVSGRLRALGLRVYGAEGAWLSGDATDDMLVHAEVDRSGRLAVRADDLVVSLDVTQWCPHSRRTAEWPDAQTLRAQELLRESMARALGWDVVGRHTDR
ncbi:hypothetical protein AQ490_19185 [Wenjunlia vitaminophila]|uniref:Uncharacterized protein n=1 Tax=Wenjunlia vitaminophila TaxID=76728 RepID=A0A0T6LUU0_WENVI|nr:hypothetical protein [Wenjunlia vitaminophila]KRV49813.1 hypothetical protein AQ490_19185 [Wenjunlia vitaminophila]